MLGRQLFLRCSVLRKLFSGEGKDFAKPRSFVFDNGRFGKKKKGSGENEFLPNCCFWRRIITNTKETTQVGKSRSMLKDKF